MEMKSPFNSKETHSSLSPYSGSLMAMDPKSNKALGVKVEQGLTSNDKGGLRGDDVNLNKDVSWMEFELLDIDEFKKYGVVQGLRGINVADYIPFDSSGNGENTLVVFWSSTIGMKAKISRMTTLVPCDDVTFGRLESDGGLLCGFNSKGVLMGNRFMDVSSLPTRLCVRYLIGGLSYYSIVNSYAECKLVVSFRIQSKLKAFFEVFTMVVGGYMSELSNKLRFDKKIPEKALRFEYLFLVLFYWGEFRCKAAVHVGRLA
ncbi:hypothetical protein Tco_0886733 [Tanacetum coccineum]